VTNGYGQTDCPGKIGPLTFLNLNGMTIQIYTSTTFMHTKYMLADGNKVWVGSINFSWTSFMKNREAGIVMVSSNTNGRLVSWYQQVFNGDFNAGIPFTPTQTYTASEMAVITNSAPVPVVIPPPYQFSTSVYVSQLSPVTVTLNMTAYTSPDFAKTTLLNAMNSIQNSLGMVMYQITDTDVCNAIINLAQNNVQMQILVSNKIYSYSDWKSATVCYKAMYEAGISFKKTEADTYTYTHAKWWIGDGTFVGLSSGNLSPTDYPDGNSFPPYGQSGWQDCNRDHNLLMQDPSIVAQFQKVLDEDYQRGTTWTPYNGVAFVPLAKNDLPMW
jgi:phosphatidylserine/phosphatidylglycerophosphate/cardiolipin synthase-like enzyme